MAQGADAAEGSSVLAGGAAEKLEEPDHSSSNWYFPREHIEKNSPSRKDGIDLKKETYLRKSYCTFLQDLGMRLKVPQVTIATAIVFSHRFFLRQSHAKNDRYLIATSCMFLAGKVEETPQKLCDVIFLSYEIRNKKDPTAVQRIKQKDIYEPQKELVLLGERLVLTTLGFDLNIHHPYKPLVAAIKKFKVAQNALAQVAWNFVNDGLRTSLCLQFKPHHIAAGAIFLAAKFLKVKLPSEGEKVWWQEFEVTPRQLEEVSNQMLELYEQNREGSASRTSDPSTSVATSNHNRAAGEAPPGSAVQGFEISTAVDAKVRANTSISKRSAGDTIPASVIGAESKAESHENMVGEQRARMDEADAEALLSSVVMSESSLAEEPKGRTEVNITVKAGTESTLQPAQVIEKNPLEGTESDAHEDRSEMAVQTLIQESDDSSGRKTEESTDCNRVVDVTPNLPTDVGEMEQKPSLPHQAQPKSEWVDLADVNIDRVKAAIQRRKKGGDKRPSMAKRELTDEEELLEMDLENGQNDGQREILYEHTQKKGSCNPEEGSAFNSDVEVEELLEMGLENVEGEVKHQMKQNKHNHQRFDIEVNAHYHTNGEGQERDRKKPRLDHGK